MFLDPKIPWLLDKIQARKKDAHRQVPIEM